MEIQEVLQKRRSIRKFTEEAVSSEDVQKLMHAAMSGPSASNRQPWEFYVVTDVEKLEKMRGVTRFTDIKAPMAIVVCGNLKKALPVQYQDYWIQDCSAATENILLSAVDQGLGAVWCGVYLQKRGEKKLAEILELPEKQIPLNIIYVGHPAEEKEEKDWYREDCIHLV